MKDTFYKQNEAALQAYSRAASQLDKMGISLGTEPEKVRQLVTETESRIADLIAELEIVRTTNQAIQEDKEKSRTDTKWLSKIIFNFVFITKEATSNNI